MSGLTTYFWKKLKSISFLSKIVTCVYYWLNNNSKKITGIGNTIEINTQGYFPFLKNVKLEIIGNENNVVINSGVHLRDLKIFIRGSRHKLIIEEGCYIKSGCLWFDDDEGKIVIGKGTYIGGAEIGVTEPKSSITIGQDCMLANDIVIISGDSHSIIDIKTNTRLNYAKDINIGNHVWIARYVQILKGVSVGSNSIIGIRSVVTKDVLENSVAVGVPAKVARTGVTWVREKVYDNNDLNL